MIAAFAALFAVVEIPPFRRADIWTFAVLAMVACPADRCWPRPSAELGGPRPAAPPRLAARLVAPAWAGLWACLANAA
ncbi:MAG: hypothetical protein R2711_11730 [Acidimicrobiales bacterium]